MRSLDYFSSQLTQKEDSAIIVCVCVHGSLKAPSCVSHPIDIVWSTYRAVGLRPATAIAVYFRLNIDMTHCSVCMKRLVCNAVPSAISVSLSGLCQQSVGYVAFPMQKNVFFVCVFLYGTCIYLMIKVFIYTWS